MDLKGPKLGTLWSWAGFSFFTANEGLQVTKVHSKGTFSCPACACTKEGRAGHTPGWVSGEVLRMLLQSLP